MNTMRISLKIDKIPVPVFGVPIPKRINPIIIILTGNKLWIRGEIYYRSFQETFCKRSLERSNRILMRRIIDFVERLSEEMDAKICFKLDVDAEGYNLPDISLYTIITSVISSSLVGDEIDPIDLQKSLIVIDRSLNIYSDYIEASRFAFAMRRNIAFRRGEETVDLGNDLLINKVNVRRHVKISGVEEDLLEGEIGDLLTKLVGYYILKIIRLLREKPDNLENMIHHKIKILKKFWEILYNIHSRKYDYIYDEWRGVALSETIFNKDLNRERQNVK